MLRPYQERMLLDLRRALKAGWQRIFLQLPTGGGKTRLAGAAITTLLTGKGAVLVPSEEILSQTAQMLADAGVPFDLVHGSKHAHPKGHRVILTTTQTMTSRLLSDFAGIELDWIVFDEAHKYFDQHESIIRRWPLAVCVALSATPVRLDGKSLGKLWKLLICGPSIGALQQGGFLVKSRCIRATMPDLSRVRIVMGDYDDRELNTAYSDNAMIEQAVESWLDHARGRPTICFCAGVGASKALVAAYRQHGVRAIHLDANTKKAERLAALERLRAGDLEVVCNVGLFVEGLDLVETSCVQLFTATWSLSRYMQYVGRGLRPSPHTGKRDLLILDYGDNSGRHGDVAAERNWFRDGELSDEKLCDECGEPVGVPKQRLCTPHLRAKLAAEAPKGLVLKRIERLQSAKTAPRPCPEWARQVRSDWDADERTRVARSLPLSYTEDQARARLRRSLRRIGA